MRKIKRIAVDQDNVIANLLDEWVNRYNNTYNDCIKPEDVNLWSWHSLTVKECGDKIYDFLDDPDLYENLPVTEGSQEVLKELSERYELFVVTAAFNPNNIPAKHKWLKKHFSFIDPDNYVFVRNKSIVRADFLIDDKPSNLKTFEGVKLLYDAPHNRNETKYIRMNNWNDIREYFQTYEQLEEYM